MKRFSCLIFFMACCLVLTGCGPQYKVVPVTGQLTIKGKPAANCRILCLPHSSSLNAGPSSAGITDEEGKFTLTTTDQYARKGAVAGSYVVRISWIDPDGTANRDPKKPPKKSPYKFPLKANDGTLTLVVPEAGTKDAKIEL